MVEFPANPTRLDPYKNFNFRLKWDGKYVAGVSKVSALKRTTEIIEFRDGGDSSASRKSPGRTEYAAITLERGLTQDSAFEDWANMVWRLGAGLGSEVALADLRKDVYLEFYNEAGQVVLAYKIFRSGRRSIRRCRRSTPTARRSPSSRSCSRTKAGSATPRWLNLLSRAKPALGDKNRNLRLFFA